MKRILYGLLFLPTLLFADVKVSNLTEQTAPKTTDYMYIVANSTSMKVKVGSIFSVAPSTNPLGIFLNGVQISSPTNQINFSGSYWNATLGNASTSTISIGVLGAVNLVSSVTYTTTAQTISGSKTFSSTQTFNNKVDIFSPNINDSDKSIINDAAVLDVWKDLNDDPADSIAMFKFIYDDGLLSEYPSFQIDSGSSTAWTPLVVKQGITGEGLISNSLIDGSSITKQGLLVAGSNITLTPGAGTLTIASTGGGGGVPTLGVFLEGVSVSSPTAQINFRSPLVATLGGTSTATITVDGSSVTLQGNTFNAANKLLQLTSGGLITNSLVDGSSITKQGLLTAGSNITLTPGAGTLTIAASGTGGGGANPLVVQYAGTNYDAAVSTINFSTSTFSLSSPIAGKVNVDISTNVTTQSFNFFVPDDGSWDNESLPIFETPTGSTVVLTNFNATAFGVGNSTITFQLNERAFGKINESGSNIFSTDITVSSTGIRTTSFLDNTIAPESYIVMVTTSNSRKGLLNGLKGIISYKRIP